MPNQPEAQGEPRPLRFEESLAELEALLERLERPDLPIEEALALFEKGMQLSEACRKELTEAESRVEILIRKAGRVDAEPFDAEEA